MKIGSFRFAVFIMQDNCVSRYVLVVAMHLLVWRGNKNHPWPAVLPSDPGAPEIVNYVVGGAAATGTALRETAFDN